MGFFNKCRSGIDEKKCKEISKTRYVLIVIGSHVLYIFSWGIVQSFGIIYLALLNYYGSSQAETSFIQSIFGGTCLGAGPVAGVLLRRLSCRTVTVIGTILLTVGFVTSMFVETLSVLYITVGIVSGFGASCLYTTAGVVIHINFDKKRALATGFAEAGTGVGTIGIPILTEYLLENYGLQITFLVVGLMALSCLAAALVFVQPKTENAGTTL